MAVLTWVAVYRRGRWQARAVLLGRIRTLRAPLPLSHCELCNSRVLMPGGGRLPVSCCASPMCANADLVTTCCVVVQAPMELSVPGEAVRAADTAARMRVTMRGQSASYVPLVSLHSLPHEYDQTRRPRAVCAHSSAQFCTSTRRLTAGDRTERVRCALIPRGSSARHLDDSEPCSDLPSSTLSAPSSLRQPVLHVWACRRCTKARVLTALLLCAVQGHQSEALVSEARWRRRGRPVGCHTQEVSLAQSRAHALSNEH